MARDPRTLWIITQAVVGFAATGYWTAIVIIFAQGAEGRIERAIRRRRLLANGFSCGLLAAVYVAMAWLFP